MSGTRDVEIVWAINPETDGPDHDRIGQRLTLPKAEARQMVNSGEARYVDIPRDEVGRSLADLPRDVAVRRAEELGLGRAQTAESKSSIIARIDAFEAEQRRAAEATELEKLTKAELRDRLPDDADVPASTTKAELLEAVAGTEAAEDAETPTKGAKAKP